MKKQLTKDGFHQLSRELEGLTRRADDLIVKIEEVAQPDESGEDSLASQLKAELEVVNSKIATIDEVLKSYEIISENKKLSDKVEVGSKVKIKITGNGERTFHIVDELEADPSINKISLSSPLGVAMMGKKIKDQFEVDAPVGKLVYKIIAIS